MIKLNKQVEGLQNILEKIEEKIEKLDEQIKELHYEYDEVLNAIHILEDFEG